MLWRKVSLELLSAMSAMLGAHSDEEGCQDEARAKYIRPYVYRAAALLFSSRVDVAHKSTFNEAQRSGDVGSACMNQGHQKRCQEYVDS